MQGNHLRQQQTGVVWQTGWAATCYACMPPPRMGRHCAQHAINTQTTQLINNAAVHNYAAGVQKYAKRPCHVTNLRAVFASKQTYYMLAAH